MCGNNTPATREEVRTVSEKNKQIIDQLSGLIPSMTDLERERMMGFGEGMAFMMGQRAEADADQEQEEQPQAEAPGA